MRPFAIALIIGGLYLMTKSVGVSGRDLIKKLEGYSSKLYKDQAGIWTIGYGHRVLPDEMEGFKNGITREQAENLLSQDMGFAINAVNYYVTVPLSQQQFDSLVSFVYNIGAEAFANSTLLKKLNTGDYASVPYEIRRWKYVTVNGNKIVSNGLINRREEEAGLFVT